MAERVRDHLGIGKGVIDFDELIPALADSYDGDWWSVDAIPMTAESWADTWSDRFSSTRCSTATSGTEEATMKAAVFYEPNDLRVEDVPEPEIADDEVLVEVAACGLLRL